MITEEQIKYMVNRFLGWKLPQDFKPDGGIHFNKDEPKQWHPRNTPYEPSGTNLFHVGQAEEMVRYMLDGLSHPESPTP